MISLKTILRTDNDCQSVWMDACIYVYDQVYSRVEAQELNAMDIRNNIVINQELKKVKCSEMEEPVYRETWN